jgi:hypothetical protein
LSKFNFDWTSWLRRLVEKKEYPMATLQDILANAQGGNAIEQIARAYGLTPEQTQQAIDTLLPAISMGLKRSTATPEGLGDLFGVAGQQPNLYAMYENPAAAFSPEGVDAGNAVLANIFGSPEASRAVANQAQQLSGIGGAILKKILPVIAGMLLSGLMRGGPGQAAPAPQPAPRQPAPPGGGGLFDIFREIFQQGAGGPVSSGPTGSGQSPVPPIGDILDTIGGGQRAPERPQPTKFPVPDAAPQDQTVPFPGPTGDGPKGQPMPGNDIFGQILTELGKAIQDGRVKPVIVGPYKVDIPGNVNMPGQQAPTGQGQPQFPGGGDIFGQILRDVLGKAMGQGQTTQQGLMDPAGSAGSLVFGDMLETGTKVAQRDVDSLQEILDRFSAGTHPKAD